MSISKRSQCGSIASALAAILVLASCSSESFHARALGGTVDGLKGTGLVLQFNGGDDLSVDAAATAFRFRSYAIEGKPFRVTVLTQPSNPTQTCSIANGERTTPGEDVSDVAVSCATNTYSIGGAVTGLVGEGLVLQLDAGVQEKLPVKAAANTGFEFTANIESGVAYSVTVATQPTTPAQACTVQSGAGVVGGEKVTSVVVNCPAVHEQNCYDGVDNDGDRLIDCADRDCADQVCRPAAAGGCDLEERCTSGVCPTDGYKSDATPCGCNATCRVGACVGKSCDDGNPCTDDSCDAQVGCVHTAVSCSSPPTECYQSPGACNLATGCVYTSKNAGSGCTKDADPCTDDVCDGQDTCIHPYPAHQPVDTAFTVPSARSDSEFKWIGTSNAVVLDKTTCLMWRSHEEPGELNWSDAKSRCAGSASVEGYGTWRLPTLVELQSLISHTPAPPMINPNFFPGTSSDWFWSSTPYAGSPSAASQVSFLYGGYGINGYTNTDRVRCVR